MSLARIASLAPALSLVGAIAAGPAAAQDTSPAPCQPERAPYADFDFWVGAWDVFAPNGDLAGTNRIEKIERGCLLLENWTGSAGGTGKSINFFDPARAQWRQVWVSANGVVIEIEGGLRGTSMVLEGTLTNAAGQTQPFKGTWTPNSDGSVRQHFEISEDQGGTWASWFDGRYVPSG
jgi:hypothetical protein